VPYWADSMSFTPAPRNDFPKFIRTYYDRCRAKAPQIEGNAGKWTPEDLIPGLSDFDTRFLVTDDMTAADWCAMSMAVGRTHLELAQERRDWARNLEHLPGVNLKWCELFDPGSYFTEFSQWSFYHGAQGKLDAARRMAAEHDWSAADEVFHWKKIAVYYGPYNRTIDPAINLGPYEDKYPLHSRLMHYLAPPVHSAVCLARKRTSPGKLEAFRAARDLFPDAGTMDTVLDLSGRHYEAPEVLCEPGVTGLDRQLEAYLTGAVSTLLENGAPFDCRLNATVPQLKAAVGTLNAASPFAQLFENIKFARLMKGRLWFYGQEVTWFDSLLLIKNELNRIRRIFYETPLRLFGTLAYGKEMSPEESLQALATDGFDTEDVEGCRRFAATADPDCPDNELKARALKIADLYDPFLCAMEKLATLAKALT